MTTIAILSGVIIAAICIVDMMDWISAWLAERGSERARHVRRKAGGWFAQ